MLNDKTIALFVLSLPVAVVSCTMDRKDSINLKKIVRGDSEIKLNQEAIKQVLQQALGSPLIIRESSATKYDESLPKVYPEKEKVGFDANTIRREQNITMIPFIKEN